MNRLTAIGLASLVAYGLLITSKYMGVVSAAHDEPKLEGAARVDIAGRIGDVERGGKHDRLELHPLLGLQIEQLNPWREL